VDCRIVAVCKFYFVVYRELKII
jgi:hypothetical protein